MVRARPRSAIAVTARIAWGRGKPGVSVRSSRWTTCLDWDHMSVSGAGMRTEWALRRSLVDVNAVSALVVFRRQFGIDLHRRGEIDGTRTWPRRSASRSPAMAWNTGSNSPGEPLMTC